MKRNFILILLLIISTALGYAQRRGLYESSHYFSCNLSCGYSCLLDNYKETKTLGGIGSVVGLGYEFRNRGFWFGVNADFQFYNSMLNNEYSDMHVQMKDTEGDLLTYHYKFKSWNDIQNALYLNIPIMVGYYGYSGFYFGAGLKYGVNLHGKMTGNLNYKTTATYDRYIEDFEDMPNHFYTDYTSDCKYKTRDHFLPNLSLCFELGGEIFNNQFYHYGARNYVMIKLAAFVEYGVTNIIINEEEKPLLNINEINPSQLDILPFYLSQLTANHRINPLYVGLKMTLLITPKTCVTCPY